MAIEEVQSSLDKVAKWATRWGFLFSPEKSQAIVFTKRRKKNLKPTLNMEGIRVPFTGTITFLGVTFTCNLAWKTYTDRLHASASKALNFLRWVTGCRWGASKDTMLILYGALVRSRLEYANFLFQCKSKGAYCKLETLNRAALRICLGIPRNTGNCELYVEAGTRPLRERALEASTRMAVKLAFERNPSQYNSRTRRVRNLFGAQDSVSARRIE